MERNHSVILILSTGLFHCIRFQICKVSMTNVVGDTMNQVQKAKLISHRSIPQQLVDTFGDKR